ncbi:hypothetical protein [Anaerococcus senegalensis]|uniref:hypothetical protein n=1 Tax=Anaerococcus senegalensis TaxID=1288120 RepID=UPI0002F99E25|nr:hypothetical protein [Anaerococcus senegalensis]
MKFIRCKDKENIEVFINLENVAKINKNNHKEKGCTYHLFVLDSGEVVKVKAGTIKNNFNVLEVVK